MDEKVESLFALEGGGAKVEKMAVEKREIIQWVRDQIQDSLLQASGLPDALGEEIRRLEQAAMVYRFLPLREFTDEDVVVAGALVELELMERRSYCLLVPASGGYVTSVDGVPVQVLSLRSPLGEALEGKKVGDVVEVRTESSVRSYRILSLK